MTDKQKKLNELGIDTNYPEYYNDDGTITKEAEKMGYEGDSYSDDFSNYTWCSSCRVYSRSDRQNPYGTCQCA